jgi:outer membrane protein assembly factor BamA
LKIATVNYVISPNVPYTINKLEYKIANKTIKAFVYADLRKSFLDTGIIFSTEYLKKERERIFNNLRNKGFYYFSKQQIKFVADSTLNEHKVNLQLVIDEKKINKLDTSIIIKSKQYRYNKIYIYPEIADIDLHLKMDTLVFSYDFDHHGGRQNYYFIYHGSIKVNPKAILQAIYLKANRFFKQEDLAYSYKSLFNLNIYKYININIIDIDKEVDGYGYLDCHIQLSKLSKFSVSSDSEFKNTGGDLGVEQGFGFTSRNTFRNGEILKLSLRTALEVQNVSYSNKENDILNIFNTFEFGINPSIEIPRFLAPVRRNFFSRYFNPKTKLELGYNYQNRPDYKRTIINANFGYRWISKKYVYQLLNLLEISSVKIFPEPEFQQIIDNYEDPRIKYSYQDHMVLGMSYSYVHNEIQENQYSKFPYKFFLGRVDIGGIPYSLISNLVGNKKDTLGQYWVGGLPFTKFIKFEADFRYFLPTTNGNITHAFRADFGIGVPLGGSITLPFEKSFYIGGANGLRAWRLGTLGPGSFPSGSDSFEMTGDLRIEFNYEFRFSISKSLKGALFTDIGNIYLLRESEALPGGAFHFNNFVEKLAADIGYGLRYDMSFLVIRLDFAHPIYQPYKEKGYRWSMLSDGIDPSIITTFNFAIGYPF